MKKFIPACLLMAAMLLASCGKDDSLENPSKYTDLGGKKSELSDTRQSKEAQIDYIQQTCVDFLDQTKDALSADLPALLEEVGYQVNNPENQKEFAPFLSVVLGSLTIEETDPYVDPSSDEFKDGIPQTKKVLDLTAFKGTFVVSKDGKTMAASDSKDFKLVSYGKGGNEYVTTLSCSGAATLIYYTTDIEKDDAGNPVACSQYFKIPRKIDGSVSCDGKVIAAIHLNCTFSSVSEEGYIDLAKSSVELSGKVTINGVTLSVDKLKYVGDKSVEAYACVTRDGKKLASIAGKASVKTLGDAVLRPGNNLTFNKFENMTDVELSANVLGRLQLRANCTNVMNFVRLGSEESDCTAELRQIASAAIYFDNGSAKQVEFDYVFSSEGTRKGMRAFFRLGMDDADIIEVSDFLSAKTFPKIFEKYKEITGRD